jgi:YidC/Oxa1 family membrane protein insertase
MPQPTNTLARIVIPVLAVVLGLGVTFAVFKNSRQKAPAAQGEKAAAEAGAGSPKAGAPAETPVLLASPGPEASAPGGAETAAAAPGGTKPGGTDPVAPSGAAFAPVAEAVEAVVYKPLGTLEEGRGSTMQIDFSSAGAGIAQLRLTEHYDSIRKGDDNHTELQAEHGVLIYDATGKPLLDDQGTAKRLLRSPMGVLGVEIDGKFVDLFNPQGGATWRQSETDAGTFVAHVKDGASGARLLRIERRYVLTDGSYTVRIEQRVENLAGRPLKLRWFQLGPVEFAAEISTYGGDKRRLRFGYLLSADADPSRQAVFGDDYLIQRATAMGSIDKATGRHIPSVPEWPNATSEARKYDLTWVGVTSRYFGVAAFPIVAEPKPGTGADKRFTLAQSVDRLALDGVAGSDGVAMSLRMTSGVYDLAAGGAADLSHAFYAGPLSRNVIRAEPLAARAGVDALVVYNFGGPCGFCTFGFMTTFLLWLLHTLHDMVVFDWALAIMMLVVLVRSCLHPVTRWSQIRMQRFGKQMQNIGPKMQKLKEKYANDPKAMQAETGKLWREEGISPTGMLGCIPMFLQMPIWIALYATLFFAAELRHEGAFFGLFQKLQPESSPFWWFLGDLSEPDRLWYFGKYFHVPLLSGMIGPIASVNILPLILGVVFFFQQKYLTPPTTMQMTPEQEMQQKMVKWMSVFMFPLFMYNAPSGLSLYFIVNSTLGIFESKWIRAHITANDLLNPDRVKATKKDQRSFFQKLQDLAEQKQKEAEGRSKRRKK